MVIQVRNAEALTQTNLSGKKYWCGYPSPSPGDLPNPGMEPSSTMSSVLQVDSLPTEPLGKPTLFLSPLVISLLLCLSLHLSLCFSYFLFPLLFRTLAPHLKVCEVSQLLLTLCDLMDCSLPGFSIHGIFQARILEWVAMSFSRGSSCPRDRTWVSHTAGRLFTI